MASKRNLVSIAVLAILTVLILNQANSWRQFNWLEFWKNAREVSLAHALMAIALTYAAYVLRAMRWRVFLRPMRAVETTRLLGPTIVGFSGLALLGRPGEFIRPYMIARKEGLSLSSQIATLAVERVFDTVSAGVLIAVALVFSPRLHSLPHMAQFQQGIAILSTLVLVFAFFLFLLARHGESLSHVVRRIVSIVSMTLAEKAAQHFSIFSRELNMIRDVKSLVQIIILSFVVWFLSGLSYLETIHAFAGARHISLGQAMLLLGFGLVGSLVQLPGGGSQQLIVIAALKSVFGLGAELAVSCSILGWLTIFMAPVPMGLILLRSEGLTLRGLSRRARQEPATMAS